jgi:hypothetical protein
MAATLTVRDETISGERGEAITLEFPTERVTVREIIRARVYQEVEDYNRMRADDGRVFRGLVQPTDTERELNGYRVKSGREIDWKQQFEKACAAYMANRVLVLLGDKQTGGLDEEVQIGRGAEATFLKLVPLVGG